MKTIKIFLASSAELREERDAITLLVAELNKSFRSRGLQLEIERWEWLNSAMGPERKQDEYNKVLEECEMCLALFWHRFGEFTVEEFNLAAGRNKENKNPERLFVFFKDVEDSSLLSDELLKFKDELYTKYKHFNDTFSNIDSLKLKFLLQLEIYQKDIIGENTIDIFNGKVCVDGKPFVNINNVSFLANNKDFIKKKGKIEQLDKQIEAIKDVIHSKQQKIKEVEIKTNENADDEIYQAFYEHLKHDINSTLVSLSNLIKEREKLQSEIDNIQKVFLNTAKNILKLETQQVNEHIQKAKELFEKGNIEAAETYLDSKNDDQNIIDSFDSLNDLVLENLNKKKLLVSIKLANPKHFLDERVKNAFEIFRQAIDLAKRTNINDSDYIELLNNICNFLDDYGMKEEKLVYEKERLSVVLKNNGENHATTSWSYYYLGLAHYDLYNYDEAIESFTHSISIAHNINCDDCLSAAYNGLGSSYYNLYERTQNVSLYEHAIQNYQLSANLGNMHAQFNIACKLYQKSKYDEALYWCRKAAEKGYGRACELISQMYMDGEGVNVNFDEALMWAIKAAETGDADLMNKLAATYESGEIVSQDYEKALFWYKQSAEKKNAEALASMAYYYENGLGVPKDITKAIELYNDSAFLGNQEAQTYLGYLYFHGDHTKKNYKKALSFLIKAAENGNENAIVSLGYMYENGCGVEQNYIKAFELYNKAANNNNAVAQFNLGCMYEKGYGINRDYSKAVQLYQIAADKNHPLAQLNLGFMYEKGYGVNQDYQKAVELYQKAATVNIDIAQCNLGYMYMTGKGITQDYKEAMRLYQLAADNNYAKAQSNLGYMYMNGLGVEKNYTRAIELFYLAAKQNDAAAQCNLGYMYQIGIGFQQDYMISIEWYTKATEQNFVQSYNQLAWTFHLVKRYKEALPWAIKAVESEPNNSNSIDTLATVYQGLHEYDKAMEQFELCLKLQKQQGVDTTKTKEKIQNLKELIETPKA